MRVRLSIEEGQITVVPVDDAVIDQWNEGACPDFEWLEMGAIECDLQFATECPAYDVDDNNVPVSGPMAMGGYESGSYYISHGRRCGCKWWPVLVPPTREDEQ